MRKEIVTCDRCGYKSLSGVFPFNSLITDKTFNLAPEIKIAFTLKPVFTSDYNLHPDTEPDICGPCKTEIIKEWAKEL